MVRSALLTLVISAPAFGGLAFVQANFGYTTNLTNTVSFASSGSANSLIVVGVDWYSTSAVMSVTDSHGSAYLRAIGPTKVPTVGQYGAIYYAADVPAGPNAVTVTFSGSSIGTEVFIAEYSGADRLDPLDVVSVGTGNGSVLDSGTVVTNYPLELLFSFSMNGNGQNTPGSGFTSRGTGIGSLIEDRFVATAGAYAATANNTAAPGWAIQLATFRAAGQDGGSRTTSDSGTGSDAGVTTDSGVVSDSGVAGDSGVSTDSGLASDSGARADSGAALDAGNNVTGEDGGLPGDARRFEVGCSCSAPSAMGPLTAACFFAWRLRLKMRRRRSC